MPPDVLGWAFGKVRSAVSGALEAQRFISKHRLIRDPEIKGRYYLSAARDRFIDADLTDPEVRESAKITIRNYRTDIRVRKGAGKKKGGDADRLTVDTSCLRFVSPLGETKDRPPL